MPRILKASLASWRAAHGFSVLNIIDPRGEHFLVEMPNPLRWADMSEPQLRIYLDEQGFPAAAIDDAIRLVREWATTTTSARLFAPRQVN
jgi:hypothetical protein